MCLMTHFHLHAFILLYDLQKSTSCRATSTFTFRRMYKRSKVKASLAVVTKSKWIHLNNIISHVCAQSKHEVSKYIHTRELSQDI